MCAPVAPEAPILRGWRFCFALVAHACLCRHARASGLRGHAHRGRGRRRSRARARGGRRGHPAADARGPPPLRRARATGALRAHKGRHGGQMPSRGADLAPRRGAARGPSTALGHRAAARRHGPARRTPTSDESGRASGPAVCATWLGTRRACECAALPAARPRRPCERGARRIPHDGGRSGWWWWRRRRRWRWRWWCGGDDDDGDAQCRCPFKQRCVLPAPSARMARRAARGRGGRPRP